jgi:hypothetical protein
LNHPNDSEYDCNAHNELDMKLDNSSVDSETTEQQNVRAAPNIATFIWPIERSKLNIN